MGLTGIIERIGIRKALRSSGIRRASAGAMVVESGLAYLRGRRRMAVLLLGAAVVAYRWSGLGILLEVMIRLTQRR